jgi:hypothetical protein
VRGSVWTRLTGAVIVPGFSLDVEILSSSEIAEHDSIQIAKDVPRTFPTNEFFSTLEYDTGRLFPNLDGYDLLYFCFGADIFVTNFIFVFLFYFIFFTLVHFLDWIGLLAGIKNCTKFCTRMRRLIQKWATVRA